MATVQERVQAGAEWLDAAKPGWWRLVDPGTLNIEDANSCILGQVFHEEGRNWDVGGYGYILAQLDDFADFTVIHDRGFSDPDYKYDELRVAWLDEVAKREQL